MANVQSVLVNAPFGAADSQLIAATSGTQAFTIKDQNTILYTVGSVSTATAALALTASDELKAGALLNLIIGASTASTVTLSGDIYSGTLAIQANKKGTITYFYDGDKFYPSGTLVNQ